MNRPLFVIKLGGSVITYKSHPSGKLRLGRIQEIAYEIKQAQEKKDFDLILVNGAGSYGHPIAKSYDTAWGVKNKAQIRGFCEIKYIVNQLTAKLNKTFLTAGLNVFSCQTSSLVIQNKGKIFSFNMAPIKQLVKLRVVPMLSGDVVADVSWGGSICSGDALAPYLAKELKATKVLFASDVDGIFDRNPQKYKNAQLIPEINKQNFSKIIGSIEESSHVDVTGGMRGKILKLASLLPQTPIEIFNGLKGGEIYRAISEVSSGTIINL